ncbi:MAG: signal peptidase I [Gemmataceae bacterium]|nr:signal peptidase I [Gemmata sp.]MDW8196334.1 signal peptidase I [Gemmataceae bacterium]
MDHAAATPSNRDLSLPSPPPTATPHPGPCSDRPSALVAADDNRENPPGRAKSATPVPIAQATPWRTLLAVGVLFLSLLLVIRTLVVEPFGVPTGSMAPALIGHHRSGPCPRCGYVVRVGRPTRGNVADHMAQVACPNCDQRFSLAAGRDIPGDRLLVDKNVYNLRSPRRWEMVVFRCPDTDPEEYGKPYVKRVVGLPGETITIAEGDVYVDDQLVRKTLPEIRELMVPVFDMNFVPQGGSWACRWLVTHDDPRLPADLPSDPLGPVIHQKALILDAAQSPQTMVGLTYRHWHLDERREQPIAVWTAYDGAPRYLGQYPAAHDFIVTCDVEVTAAAPQGEASLACRLRDGADAVSVEITVGDQRTGQAHLVRTGHGGLCSRGGVALAVGRTYRFEFALVDRRAIVAINGHEWLCADLPAVRGRHDVSRPLQLGARGCRVVVRQLQLWRDTHYTSDYGLHGTRQPARLGPHEYFVLGDNSGNSQDSRKWPAPGVPERDLIGKPFLIHQPLRIRHYRLGGREQDFQTLDWSRLRWLH